MMSQVYIIFNLDLYGLRSIERWLDFISESPAHNMNIIIVANKIDKTYGRYLLLISIIILIRVITTE